ncbi:metallophosphoesterase [Lactobacillus hominis]|uniref:metallophosphoesterase n=1 Tax=Lactobacillus hominis TaxID=1203033 RepID=UPI0023F2EE25|nr:metallophosphoesterase [Lactobacillus hominis]
MITENDAAKFWVISDTHLIADSLHDNGQAFSQMQKTSQGKDLYYQEVVLSAFVKKALDKKPDAIIVTGDVTFNGERVSAQRFAEIFKPLKGKTKLLILPGNHDIYDGWAREFRGKKQYYAGQISPLFWKNIFRESYKGALSEDDSSLAYSQQLNSDFLLIMLDSNIYGSEESTTAPATHGKIGKEQLKWFENQLRLAQEKSLHPIVFMHHNLYAHNPAVNKSYVLDNANEIRRLFGRYGVKLVFSGHIHAQNILGPQIPTPTSEIVSSSFCSTDQGYGEVHIKKNNLEYRRHSFDMSPYLSEKEKQNWTLTHFHDYLENIQLGSLAANLMQKDLNKYHNSLDLIRKMGKLFSKMNYNFFTGKNHISKAQLDKLHASETYKVLVQENPEVKLYLETLYDISDHDNLNLKIRF